MSSPIIPDMPAWWTASDSARSHWDGTTDRLSTEEASRVLESELRRLLTDDLGRSPAFVDGLLHARPKEAEPRQWLLNAVAFYSARVATQG